MKAWFDHILFHTRTQPQRPAIVLVDRAITYGMLAAGIDGCARQLALLGLDAGATVAIAVASPLRQMVLSLALFRIGIPSLSIERNTVLPSAMGFAAVLCDPGTAAPAGASDRVIAVPDAWFGPSASGGASLRGFADSGQVCRLSLTSGSTGEPKLQRDTIAAVGDRVFGNFFGGIDASRSGVLCMLGLSTTFGFGNACATLAAGRPLYLADSSGQAITMIELFSIDFLLASTEQTLALAATARRTGAQVRSLRTVVSGGSVPTRTLLEAAMTYLCKDIVCQYGATEIGLIARAMARDVLTSPALVGFVVPGVEVAVFDAAGNRCGPDQVGLIKLRRTADGAITDPADHAWISPGDRGWLAADGRLYVTGRTADAAGARISPALEIEHVLRLEHDYDDAAAVEVDNGSATGPESRVKIGIVNNRDATADKIEASLRRRGIPAIIELIDLKSIPRGAGGKVNRDQLRSALVATHPALPQT
jgi:acyl-coenzyme A synthetase/AMP-(fatty) acid ligase